MQNTIIECLTTEFTKSRLRNPSYSLRAFAKRLNIPVSALSEILNGKRSLSNKMAHKVCLGLGINPSEYTKTLSSPQDKKVVDLSLDYFKVISDWYYFAILSLAEIPQFKADPDWISKRLNITKREAKMALVRLIHLEMLAQDENGLYYATNVQYKTPTDVINLSLKNHTLQTLELASNSLFNDPIESRDFSTVTMAIDPAQIGEAKKMIKSFRRKLSLKLESGKKKEVYKLAIQLFPLTHNGENDHV